MQIFFGKFNTSRNFGIELEIGKEVPLSVIALIIAKNSKYPLKSGSYKQSVNNDYWDLKYDASCGQLTDCYGINEGGFEITSFKASGIKQLQHISKIAKKIKQAGVLTNRHCGLHVHVDIKDFNNSDVGNFVLTWMYIEKMFLLSVPERRRCNKYCTPLYQCYDYNKLKGLKSPEHAWEYFKPLRFSMQDNIERRRVLNIVNYYRSTIIKSFKRPTIEFRFPEGTLVESNIKNWTRLLLNFINNYKTNSRLVQKCDKFLSVEEFLQILGLGENGANFKILSQGLRETKIWFLKRLLRYSKDDGNKLFTNIDHIREQIVKILDMMGVHNGK